MSWGNDKNTLICEKCGVEGPPEDFKWFDDEVPICKDAAACVENQSRLVANQKREERLEK